jgi:NurA-like 5'-3' nuclease
MSVVDDDGSEVDVFRKLEEVQRELNKAIAEARKLRLTTGANSD